MPFTPLHMGPGILLKALLQGSFSLLVFGWSQIIMDIQPLIVILTGEGHLHGFTHTYLGGSSLAFFSAVSGKYLVEFGLSLLGLRGQYSIKWWGAFLSAFIGCFSHVILDSIMHQDLEPFYPLNPNNELLGIISVTTLHKLCLYSGLVGGALFFLINRLNSNHR